MERSPLARMLVAGALALSVVAATPSTGTVGEDAPIVLGEVNTISTETGSASHVVTFTDPIPAFGTPGSISFETDGGWTALMLTPVGGDGNDYLLVTAPSPSVFCEDRLPDDGCAEDGLGTEFRVGNHWDGEDPSSAFYVVPPGDYWLSIVTDQQTASATWRFEELDGDVEVVVDEPLVAAVDDLTVRSESVDVDGYTQTRVEGDARTVQAEKVIVLHWIADAFTVKNDVERTHCFYPGGEPTGVGGYTHRCLGGGPEGTVIVQRGGNTGVAPLGGRGDYVIFGWEFLDRSGPVAIGGAYTSTGLNHRVEMGGVWIVPPDVAPGTIEE